MEIHFFPWYILRKLIRSTDIVGEFVDHTVCFLPWSLQAKQ